LKRHSEEQYFREHFEKSEIRNLGVLLTRGRALVLINPKRNRTAVIWEVVTWTRGISRKDNARKSFLANRHFSDQEVKGTEALDIGTLRVPKPEIHGDVKKTVNREDRPMDLKFEIPTGNQESYFSSGKVIEQSLDREVDAVPAEGRGVLRHLWYQSYNFVCIFQAERMQRKT
jgi:hypothetical protein